MGKQNLNYESLGNRRSNCQLAKFKSYILFLV